MILWLDDIKKVYGKFIIELHKEECYITHIDRK